MSESATIRSIHLTAICGVGMAPLAVALKRAGYRVTGSDKQAFPPMSRVLADAGIPIREGFAPENLEPRPDLVIVGNAVTATNAEAVAVEKLGIPRMSFPEAVGRFLIGNSKSLVVAGTHGKTTTTGMLAVALEGAGVEPGYLVGGLIPDLGELACVGAGTYFAIEGDEYDTAYFDKRPKFLHYRPQGVILTSVEFDHADIYRDEAHVEEAFGRLLDLLGTKGPLVACADYAAIRRLVAARDRLQTVWYGAGEHDGWTYRNVRELGDTTVFDALHNGKIEATLALSLHGEMNAANATAVYALTRALGLDSGRVTTAIARYRGGARRQEKIGERGGIVVIDDFAHHPTAVRKTLEAMARRYAGRRLVAVFEPRSNTSRRAVFQEAYAEALSLASIAAVSSVYAKQNDPLKPSEMLSTERLVADLGLRGTDAWCADGPDEILARLPAQLRAGDVVLCMSNGAFGNLPRRLLALLGGSDGAQTGVQP
jgi:UDP-N-acetylmuramate: L-alanyl-gamma-D-glutamyl-meso-diaminopimelate ligase